MRPEPVATLRVPGVPDGLSMRVHGPEDLCISRQLLETGIWEPFETSLVQRFLEPGDVFVDVGANIGYFTVLAALCVGPAGRVFAVEPDPANLALLRENLQRNACADRVQLQAAALAAADGVARLHLSEDNLGDHQMFDTGGGRASVEVPLLDGGRWLGGQTRRVDMLKVDTQGYEYEVMSGLVPLLRTLPRMPRILIELTPLSLRQAGSSGRTLVELLASLGQPLWIVDHIEHRLVACSMEELARWSDNVDACPGDAGFMNLLVGAA
ncbi:FkbM family methyltransferase [Parahaliea maris]|uniref:FkbM family methyltransferase n=1 Tax=Parahaliea maris TaxID=2716870 RepID=A0A5C8ZW21_9GAMM|nr:FkbM family methyltransferase [Parahaliea maris]TXS92733.1 FkbM family methyltransferase [Parahaliea maris]